MKFFFAQSCRGDFYDRLQRKLLYIFAVLFFFNSLNAIAEVGVSSSDPYHVEIPIASNNLSDRDKAFTEGFKKVLIGITHQQAVINAPVIKSKLNKAEIYVRSFNYAHKANVGQQDLFLVIDFDSRGIEQLLSLAKVKISAPSNEMTENLSNTKESQVSDENQPLPSKNFSGEKNDVLVWLTVLGNLPKDNIVFSDSSGSDFVADFKNNAHQMDINILLPVMDLTELAEVTADDICNFNTETIVKASQKYHSGAAMIGCISKNIIGKKGQWLLLANKKQYAWFFYGADDNEILKQALVSTAKVLNADLKNTGKQISDTNNVNAPKGPIEKVTIKVEGVSSLEQYNDVIKYLQSIAPISNVELLNLDASAVELRMSVAGGKDAFIASLASPEQNKLIMMDVDDNSNGDDILNYRLAEYNGSNE